MNRHGALLGICLVFLSACTTVPVDDSSSGLQDGNGTMELYQEGLRAYSSGNLALAERNFVEVIERVPKDAQVWFRLGNIYAQTDRPRQAVAAYQNALVRDPDLAKAWHNLGVVHLRQAVNDFLSLANSVPENDPLYHRGKKMSQAIIALIGELPENSDVEVDLDLEIGEAKSADGGPERAGSPDDGNTEDNRE